MVAATAVDRSVTLHATVLHLAHLVLALVLCLAHPEVEVVSEVATMVYKTTALPPVTSVVAPTIMPETVKHRQ